MDPAAAIGVFLALLALAVTVTPGIQNWWAAVILWLGTFAWALWMSVSHRDAIARMVSDNPRRSTLIVASIVAISVAWLWYGLVVPYARNLVTSPPKTVVDALAIKQSELNQMRGEGRKLKDIVARAGDDRRNAEMKCKAWVKEVYEFLRRELPEYSEDFLVDPPASLADIVVVPSLLSSWVGKMERRLVRLEIINQRLTERQRG
jgi:hypothetical protein